MKILILFFIVTNVIFAKTTFDVQIIKDKNFTFENIKDAKDFEKTSPFIKFNSSSNYWLKLRLKGNDFEDKYVLAFYSKLFINPVKFEKNDFFLEPNIIEIKNNKPIYVKVLTPANKINLNISLEEKSSYIKEHSKRKELYGISYGIIFTAFIYYLAFYIFNKEKSFIYYSLTQIFIFLLIYFSFKDYRLSHHFYEFFIFGFLFFSNFFTKEFLNTKKQIPFLNKLLTVLAYLFILELILSLFDVDISLSWVLLIYLICAIVVYKKTKSKPIIFYMIAWSIVIFTYIFVDYQTIFINQDLNPIFIIDLIHFTIPLESLILAFALSYKMKLSEEEKKKKQSLLIHQNRLSSMGEMISNITHQWRQSLTHLGYIFININTAFKHNKLDKKYLEEKVLEANNQLLYMSETLEDFKDFYSINKEKKSFSALKSIQKALTIFSSSFLVNKIDIDIKGDDFYIYGYENEFSQVLLNLLNNSKDALINKKIENPLILIELKEDSVCIIDNAKGIEKKIKEKIFEPYFSTKDKGSGIGLYMSKTIIEKSFHGKLYFKNTKEGCAFCVNFKKEKR